MSTLYNINEGAPVTAPTFTALTTPGGFIGDGTLITLNNPSYIVVTNASNQLNTAQYVTTAQGGLGAGPSTFGSAGTPGVIVSNGTGYSGLAYTSAATASTLMSRDSSANTSIAGLSATTVAASTSVTTPTVAATGGAGAIILTGGSGTIAVNGANGGISVTGTNGVITVSGSNGGISVTGASGTISGPLITASTSLTTPLATITAGSGIASSLAPNILTLGSITATPASATFRTAFVQTTNSTATALFTIPTSSTATTGSKATTYLISCTISFGDATNEVNSGAYQFTFKAKNVNGASAATVTNLVHTVSLLDGTLSGVSVGVPTPTSSNVVIQVTGLASTNINWYGLCRLVQVVY